MATERLEGFDVRVRGHRLRVKRFGSPDAPLVLGLAGLSGTVESLGYIGDRIGGDALQLVAIDCRVLLLSPEPCDR